ncbi:MAG TPA: uroporphyrinogen-III synthase [Nitrososphaera sp.]|nr:uroporphyrinogen-III synthase [Nitrososphaera sp.]
MPGLKDKVIAITRGERDAAEFSQLVSEEGGRAIALPTIEVVPKGPDAAKDFLARLEKKKHDYCAFMSPQAVKILFDYAGREAALALKSTTVIAVGPKTKESLVEHGVNVRLMPAKFSSAGLVELLSALKAKGEKIIIPRSGAANEFATKALEDLGMQVDEVLLYTVRTAPVTFAWSEFSELLLQKKVDAVIFTSASSVGSFFEIMGKLSGVDLQLDTLAKVVSIGPFTSKELKGRMIKYFEAEEHTVRGALELARKIV